MKAYQHQNKRSNIFLNSPSAAI